MTISCPGFASPPSHASISGRPSEGGPLLRRPGLDPAASVLAEQGLPSVFGILKEGGVNLVSQLHFERTIAMGELV